MPVQLNSENDGKILTIHVNGNLINADYEHFLPEIDRFIQQHSPLRLLFDMSGLHGWEFSTMWEDIKKLGIEHFGDIERLAMVGKTQLQHAMATLCKPFTKAEIRYFDHADITAARQWLSEA